MDTGEECDDGDELNGKPRSNCTLTCKHKGYCGNALLDEGEECDYGSELNGSPQSNCTRTCKHKDDPDPSPDDPLPCPAEFACRKRADGTITHYSLKKNTRLLSLFRICIPRCIAAEIVPRRLQAGWQCGKCRAGNSLLKGAETRSSVLANIDEDKTSDMAWEGTSEGGLDASGHSNVFLRGNT